MRVWSTEGSKHLSRNGAVSEPCLWRLHTCRCFATMSGPLRDGVLWDQRSRLKAPDCCWELHVDAQLLVKKKHPKSRCTGLCDERICHKPYPSGIGLLRQAYLTSVVCKSRDALRVQVLPCTSPVLAIPPSKQNASGEHLRDRSVAGTGTARNERAKPVLKKRGTLVCYLVPVQRYPRIGCLQLCSRRRE